MKELFFLIPIGLVAYIVLSTSSSGSRRDTSSTESGFFDDDFDLFTNDNFTPLPRLSLGNWNESPLETIEQHWILGGKRTKKHRKHHKKTKRHSK
jgi:hypothetical protein